MLASTLSQKVKCSFFRIIRCVLLYSVLLCLKLLFLVQLSLQTCYILIEKLWKVSEEKYNLIKWIFQHGADANKKNRDGATPLELVREGDQDVADLLRGNAALLDAAKKGNLARVQRLLTPDNINCRDTQGRNSTPLHLAGSSSACFVNRIVVNLFTYQL